MDDAKRELVRAWLIKARNDLTTARGIGSLPDGPLDTAIYHCQQVAEKAVKGFLAFHDHRLERSHDVERLAGLAAGYEASFKRYEDAAITLTPYATAYRYPGESAMLEPSRAEFDEALKLADGFLTFVCSLLPAEVQPGK
ncbi:MAG TPA: HEPN domain-containing protein [Verrucomicrobiae bacterium]|nr:HEPN domain-containing protein [Verrucomicrobiae bacterium]